MKTPCRKFGKVKNNRKHKNKYEKFSLGNEPHYTDGREHTKSNKRKSKGR